MVQDRGRGVARWWDGAVGYEIYIRSFADSDGDGVGDLAGITGHLEHAAWLGVDIVWITPFMPSPGFDHGYDISDYCDVDPLFGTLVDFERTVERAHELGLRVLVDLVPNHTSARHPWFLDAISSPTSVHRDWYIWADGRDGGPPNNWVSHFGGPAWTRDAASGQWYCHLFLPEQPDLNWANEAVRAAFDDVLRFWCERGADGFRIDVAHSLTKNLDLADNPRLHDVPADAGPTAVFESFAHLHDLDQEDNVEVYRRWREIVAPYDAMLVGEVDVATPDRSARYTEPGLLDTVFFLRPAWCRWEPARLVALLTSMHDADPDGVSWTMNSHDTSRSVSRFGGGPVGWRRTLAVTAFQFALGGVPFLYQGEELGLDDPVIAPGDRADPIWTRNAGDEVGRDGARTGMPWTDGPGNGFSTARAWLPAEDRSVEQTVAHQRATPGTPLHRYRELIAVRRDHPELHRAPLAWLPVDRADAAVARRGDLVVVANLGSESLEVDGIGTIAEVVFASDETPAWHSDTVRVGPESTVYLRTR